MSSRTGHSGRTEPPEGGRTPQSLSPLFCWEKTDPSWEKAAPAMRRGQRGLREGGPGSCPFGCSGGDTSPWREGPPRGTGQWEGDKTPHTEPTASLLSPGRAAGLLTHGVSNNTLVWDQYSHSLEQL